MSSLAKRARIVIANDSGISHVAAAISANQITLLGVTDPARTRPWNSKAVCLGNSTAGWPSLEQVLAALKDSLR